MNRWDSIRMNVMQYYVKRCIALPGDTLEIRGGFYKVRGCHEQLGNYKGSAISCQTTATGKTRNRSGNISL